MHNTGGGQEMLRAMGLSPSASLGHLLPSGLPPWSSKAEGVRIRCARLAFPGHSLPRSSTLNHIGSSIQSATHPMPRELPYVPWSPLVMHRGERTWFSWPGRISQDYSIQQTPLSPYLSPELITRPLEKES